MFARLIQEARSAVQEARVDRSLPPEQRGAARMKRGLMTKLGDRQGHVDDPLHRPKGFYAKGNSSFASQKHFTASRIRQKTLKPAKLPEGAE